MGRKPKFAIQRSLIVHNVRRYTESLMLVLVHTPLLFALMALQFRAAGLDKPTRFWLQFSQVLMVLAVAAVPLSLWVGDMVGTRVAVGALIIAMAGFAGYRRIEFVTRWFRWLSLASWCLCIMATCGMIGFIIARRLFGI
jgi:hypothetical protein